MIKTDLVTHFLLWEEMDGNLQVWSDGSRFIARTRHGIGVEYSSDGEAFHPFFVPGVVYGEGPGIDECIDKFTYFLDETYRTLQWYLDNENILENLFKLCETADEVWRSLTWKLS